MQKTDKKPSATSLVAELTKLRAQQKYLETTQATLKPHSQSPHEYADLNELECLQIEQDLNLATFTDKLKHDSLHIRDTITAFRTEMLHPSALSKFHTKQYREQIELIDQRLQTLAAASCEQVRRLKLEYSGIESDLVPLMVNLDVMEKSTGPAAMGRRPSAGIALQMGRVHSAPIDRTDLDDVRRFDRFVVEHGGHTAGWSSEEHAAFVKMRNKYKTNVDEVCAGLKVFYIGEDRSNLLLIVRSKELRWIC